MFVEDLPMNIHVQFGFNHICSFFYADRKSKMATTAGHRLTLDPMGKCSNALFSETTNMGHLGFPIGIKNRNLVKDIPMIIHLQFGFSQFISFREENL
jgi:hypothetical protein